MFARPLPHCINTYDLISEPWSENVQDIKVLVNQVAYHRGIKFLEADHETLLYEGLT